MKTQSVAKPRGGNGTDGGASPENIDEPGAVDNRLTITPSDFPVTESWEDGGIYSLSQLGADVKIRQISPGEFEVLPGMAEPSEGAEEETGEEGEGEGEVENPAMSAMMDRYK